MKRSNAKLQGSKKYKHSSFNKAILYIYHFVSVL